jgi:hypothetical protein
MLLLLISCAYTADDYWDDLITAHCQCEQESAVANCQDEWEQALATSDYYDDCADAAAPVERTEMRDWVNDYTDACRYPDEQPPEPADPNWYLSCEPL